MTKVYGIVGAGKASTKAIRTALDDLEKDAVFYVPFFRSTSVEDVYDWLLDNERDYVLIGNRASRILMRTSWAGRTRRAGSTAPRAASRPTG